MSIIDQSRPRVQRYDRAASFWESKMSALGYTAAYRDAVATLLPWQLASPRVMDVGCGAGDFAAAFAANRGIFSTLTLTDPAVAMLNVATARLSQSARQLSVQAQPIESLSGLPRQDVILCAHVIEHCADPAAALRHLGSFLSPTGSILLVISKPHWCNWLIWLRWQHRSFSKAEVLAMVASAGLCCTVDMSFSRGPPRRTSHAYRINLPQGDPLC